VAGAVALPLAACSSYTKEEQAQIKAEERAAMFVQVEREARDTIEMFKEKDPTASRFFNTAAGYAVFPKVTKGAAGIGAAHGNGVLYDRNGAWLGNAEVSQGSIGAQIGGQTFREIIFFEDNAAIRKFKDSTLEFSANASAVAVESGAAAAADYREGVAVFTMTRAGLMLEASIGGQGFTYEPR
jgi:lipid-binding SYLF domain-containing protein